MILIPERKLVILLPWKAASQTLRARLAPLNKSPHGPFFRFDRHLGCVVHQHLTLGQFLALPESRQGHRLAVFVRNPYDRVFSGFLQLQRDIRQQPSAAFPAPWIRQLVLHQLTGHQRSLTMAGNNLDSWFRELPVAKVLCAGQDSNLPLHPCHYWTHSGGQLVADFIGRVENFEQDFAQLCQQFDVAAGGDATLNVTPGMPRQSDEDGYRYAARLAPDTIRKVNILFRGDFQLFGYRMIVPGTAENVLEQSNPSGRVRDFSPN